MTKANNSRQPSPKKDYSKKRTVEQSRALFQTSGKVTTVPAKLHATSKQSSQNRNVEFGGKNVQLPSKNLNESGHTKKGLTGASGAAPRNFIELNK